MLCMLLFCVHKVGALAPVVWRERFLAEAKVRMIAGTKVFETS